MNTLRSLIKGKSLAYGAVVVLLVAGAGLLFSRNGGPDQELLTLTRGDFVQEVSVSGKVIAARDVDLGFSQSGRIAGVYGKVGQTVQTGAALAELENGDLRASVLQKQAALEREKASLAVLNEGTRPEELEVARSEVQSDEVVLAQTRDALVEAVRDAFTTSDDAVRNTLDQFIDTSRTNPQITFIVNNSQLENRIENSRRAIELILTEWQRDVEGLATVSGLSGAVSRADANLVEVASLLTDASAALNKAVPTGSITQSIVDGYKTDIASARSDVNAAISALTTAITAEKNAVSALETSRKNLVLKEAGARASDVVAQEAQIKASEADLASARAQLEKTIMRAPFTGIVTKMDLKAGGIASANTSEASMISAGTFQIESFVPEVNIALIEVRDMAAVTLDAYGGSVVFPAHVVSIDPAETVRDGVSTYRAILQFEARDERVRSGMTANVRITTDEREGILSVPRGIVLEREGKKYVRIKAGDSVEEREVATGSVSSLGDVEILAGLSEGDVVVLSP